MPTACPFCRSNHLVTGKLAGGIEESAAYIALAGVSIPFWKGEITCIVNAVEVEEHIVLCLDCGVARAKADNRSALKLIEGHGSEELKRIALAGGSSATQLGNSGVTEGPPSVS